MSRNLKWALALAIPLLLGACASNTSPDYISRDAAQQLSQVENGIILSTRMVTVAGSQSGIGALAGGAIGALAGSSVTRSGPESAIFGIAGAIAGGLAGNEIEKGTTKEKAVELTIRLSDGRTKALVQGMGAQQFMAGDHVQIITADGKTRVVRVAAPIPAQ